MDVHAFSIKTYEAFKTHEPHRPIECPQNSTGSAFRVSDPFGLRRAVLPVFRRDPDGSVLGIGTAFHVDGWGGLLTADHVVDFMRDHLPPGSLKPGMIDYPDAARTPHATVLLGIGVVFGTISIPETAFAPIGSVYAIVAEKDDPLASLRGESSFFIGADLASMHAFLHLDSPPAHTVPVMLKNWQPTLGEPVFAIGYPELRLKSLAPDQIRDFLEEGMYGAYGHITGVFPTGRDASNPTPVFEVEAYWRSGMSGGPVFNRDGYVVGIVSLSLEPGEGAKGVGYATCLSLIPEAGGLIPTLDANNPGWRLGYGVFRTNPWHLVEVFQKVEEAEKLCITMGSGYQVAFGSHQLGSDNFVSK
jgi:serine protease Do